MEKGAIFSECRTYRYLLWRVWDESNPDHLMVIGLNPSTADETEDDPTIRRCINFAKEWGYGGLHMLNLFAYRATKPKDMISYHDPIGPQNDMYLSTQARAAGMILAALGNHGSNFARDHDVRKIIESYTQMKCLGKTKSGQPRHPLYIKADFVPELF